MIYGAYTLINEDNAARYGALKTRAGIVETPLFFSVATRGCIKGGVDSSDLEAMNAPFILSNTYHLGLKPGKETLIKLGGLKNMMRIHKPLITDSGGFQVFSLRDKTITDDGVFFRSHIDGKPFYIDAEESMRIQHAIGSDVMMAFDQCPPNVPDRLAIRQAVERTTAWAKRSLSYHHSVYNASLDTASRPQLWGIVQGGCYSDLRDKSLREITALPFDGLALGGLAVGEPPEAMYATLKDMSNSLPKQSSRYLMGVGTPWDILIAVYYGIDMFDCVMPMRNARHGTLYTNIGVIKLTNEKYRYDNTVLDSTCDCHTCTKGYTKAYLHHLFSVQETLVERLCTIHNLRFYIRMMEEIRVAIQHKQYKNYVIDSLKRWNKKDVWIF